MKRFLTVYLLCVWWLPNAWALPVTVTGSTLVAQADDEGANNTVPNATLPVLGVPLMATAAAGLTNSFVSLTATGDVAPGGHAAFTFGVDQNFDNSNGPIGTFALGTLGDSAQGAENQLFFTADVNAAFSLDVDLDATFNSATGVEGRLFVQAQLIDVVNGTIFSPVISQFFSGMNTVTQNISGSLIAGNSYQLLLNTGIQSRSSGGQSTQTTGVLGGQIVFSINEVPEPTTVALLGLALVGAGRRLRKQS